MGIVLKYFKININNFDEEEHKFLLRTRAISTLFLVAGKYRI